MMQSMLRHVLAQVIYGSLISASHDAQDAERLLQRCGLLRWNNVEHLGLSHVVLIPVFISCFNDLIYPSLYLMFFFFNMLEHGFTSPTNGNLLSG